MKKILASVLFVWLLVLTAYVVYDKTSDKVVYIDLIKVHDDFELTKTLSEEYDVIKKQQQNIMDSLVTKKHFEDEAENMQYLRSQNNQFLTNMEKISATYNNQIWKRINQYVGEYGKKNKLDFVFGIKGEGNVMYSNEAYDLTNEMVQYINSRYEGKL